MTLTQEKLTAKNRTFEKAFGIAVREFFTGPGAGPRRIQFIRGAFFKAVCCFCVLICLGSWAVIAGLLIGPSHEVFLSEFHEWMVTTPVKDVLAQGHALIEEMAWDFVRLSLLCGALIQLVVVVKPQVDQAMRLNLTNPARS